MGIIAQPQQKSTTSSQIRSNLLALQKEGASFCKIGWGRKFPQYQNWQSTLFSVREIDLSLTGAGILLGHGNLCAIDIDNQAGADRFTNLFGQPPQEFQSVSWASGKRFDGSYSPEISPQSNIQVLFKLNSAQSKKLSGRKAFENNSLDIRWSGSQSVLPSLAPHPGTGQPYYWVNSPSNVAIAPMPDEVWQRMLSELEATPGGKQSATIQPSLNLNDEIPLIQCLAKKHRQLIESGVQEGGRNDTGTSLARDLIGTSTRLDYLSIQYSDRPDDLFEQFCDRCTPPLPPKERKTIWKSAVGSNPTPCLTDEMIENCVKAWRRQQQRSVKPFKSNRSGVERENLERIYQGAHDWTASVIRDRLEKIAHQNLSESDRKLAISELAQQSRWPVNRLASIYQDIVTELDELDSQQTTKEEIEQILKATQSSVDLSEVLPENLAKPLKQLADWMNLRPEAYLMSLLATASSLHRTGTELIAATATDYRVSSNLFVSIVAESSQKKSPILKAITSKPLALLHRDECDRYDQEMAAWKENCKKIQSEDKNAELPPEPQKRVHLFNRTTGEAILRQAGRQNHGMLYLTDELKALFGSQNSYRGGRGADEEDLLELYDGTGGKVMRADGLRDDVERLNLGILGAIQPEVLEKLVGNNGDGNGKWARFIFVNQPLTASTLPVGGGVSLTDLLAGLYRSISTLPEIEYRFNPEAMERFKQAYDRLEKMRIKEPKQAMRSVLGKTAGRIAKLALNLHTVRWAMGDRTQPISYEIGMESLIPAIKLAKFAIEQIKSLYGQFDNDSLAPHLAKVLELAKSKEDWIKAGDVQQKITKKHRPSADQARQWFQALADMGFGKIQGSGRSLQFSAIADEKTDKSSKIDNFLDKPSITENLATQEIKPFLDKLDDLNNISESVDAPTISDQVAAVETVDEPPTTSDQVAAVETVDEPPTTSDQVAAVETAVGESDGLTSSQADNLNDRPKTTPTRTRKRWYEKVAPKDDRLPLLKQAMKLAKSISQEQLNQLIAKVYGVVIEIEKLSNVALGVLIDELKEVQA